MYIFRLAFALVTAALLITQAQFTKTVHIVNGNHHIFKQGWLAWFFFGLMLFTWLVFGYLALRFLKDKFVAGITLVCTVAAGILIFPSIYDERIEITGDELISRRGWPHNKLNAEIPLVQIASATRLRKARPGWVATVGYDVGYELMLTDGTSRLIPSTEVPTAAQGEIDRILADRQIPVVTRTKELDKD